MVRLSDDGRVVNNVQVHAVELDATNSILGGIWSRVPQRPSHGISVNSVHWLACDDRSSKAWAQFAHITARSTSLPNFTLRTRQGVFMRPTEGTPEAIEQRFGAPVIGVQWHPEAYVDSKDAMKTAHISLILEIALAGDAFRLRRQSIDSDALLAALADMRYRSIRIHRVRAWLRRLLMARREEKLLEADMSTPTPNTFLSWLAFLDSTAQIPSPSITQAVAGGRKGRKDRDQICTVFFSLRASLFTATLFLYLQTTTSTFSVVLARSTLSTLDNGLSRARGAPQLVQQHSVSNLAVASLI